MDGDVPEVEFDRDEATASNVAELRLAPQTTTSVVTTTTTTTVHFAPIQIPKVSPPIQQNGFELDSRRFPLANAPFPGTSSDPQGFRIDLGSHTAQFVPESRARRTTRPVITPPHESTRDRSPPRKRARAASTAATLPVAVQSPEQDAAAAARHGLPSPRLEATDSVQVPANSSAAVSALYSLPSLIDSFDTLPVGVQSYVMFQLLRRSSVPVLQSVNTLVSRALTRDFLTDLPPELAIHILGFCDVQSLCCASGVSKAWRGLVDGEWRVWKDRMVQDDFWIGDGTDQEDAQRIMIRKKGAFSESLFLKRWREGVWHEEQSSRGKREADRDAIELLSPKLSRTRTSQSRSFGSMVGSSGGRLASPSSSREPSPVPESDHFVHPYKLLYKRRFIKRSNWTNREPRRLSFPCQANNVVTCLQFDKDKIISASDDHSIHVFSTKTGELLTTLDGHEGGVWALQYVGNVLVSGSTDRTIRVWDVDDGRCTHVFVGHTSTVRCLQIVEPVNVNPDPRGPPVWEPSQPLIVTGSRDWMLRVWKLPLPGRDPDYLPDMPMSPTAESAELTENPYHVRLLQGHRHAVRSLAAHGRTLVSGSYDNTVRVWDLMTGECKHRLAGHTQKVYSIVYDHHRKQCASGSMDGDVRLWSTETGECLATLDGHSSLVGLLGLSSRHLISAAADSTLRIWDPANGQFRHALVAHSGAITCFQHDDEKIVSGSDGTLKLWNTHDGSFRRNLLMGLMGVWQVAFDDRYCVAAVQRDGQSEFDVLDFGPIDDDEDDEDEERERTNRLGQQRHIQPLTTGAPVMTNPFGDRHERSTLTQTQLAERANQALRRIPSTRALAGNRNGGNNPAQQQQQPREPGAQSLMAARGLLVDESPTARRTSNTGLHRRADPVGTAAETEMPVLVIEDTD